MDYIQRVIVETYNMMGYGDLKSDVKEKTHGDLQDFMMSLLSDRLDFEAQTVMRAIKGLGTDEATLITILCTLAEEDILPLQMAFSSRYEKSMEQAVLSETSGKFKRVLLLAGCDGVGESYAKVINSAVAGLGTDTKAIIRLMVTATPEQLDATREAYSRIYKKDLIRAVGSEWKVSGDFKRIIEALAKRHPANVNDDTDIDYSADVQAMRDAVEGMGTDEAAVIALLANKSHKQIEAFREAYKIETGELLRERIRNETTGLFESKLFRETLMGLLTPREEQIAIYLGEAMAGWGQRRLGSHFYARSSHGGRKDGDSHQVHRTLRWRSHRGHPLKLLAATTKTPSWRASLPRRARSPAVSESASLAGSRARTRPVSWRS